MRKSSMYALTRDTHLDQCSLLESACLLHPLPSSLRLGGVILCLARPSLAPTRSIQAPVAAAALQNHSGHPRHRGGRSSRSRGGCVYLVRLKWNCEGLVAWLRRFGLRRRWSKDAWSDGQCDEESSTNDSYPKLRYRYAPSFSRCRALGSLLKRCLSRADGR